MGECTYNVDWTILFRLWTESNLEFCCWFSGWVFPKPECPFHCPWQGIWWPMTIHSSSEFDPFIWLMHKVIKVPPSSREMTRIRKFKPQWSTRSIVSDPFASFSATGLFLFCIFNMLIFFNCNFKAFLIIVCFMILSQQYFYTLLLLKIPSNLASTSARFAGARFLILHQHEIFLDQSKVVYDTQ